MKTKKLRKALLKISKNPRDSIVKEVAKAALDYPDESTITFFNDLLHYGCQSGMITSLIYYKDTHAFYLKYYDEIECLRFQFEESTGESLSPKGDLMNWFSWFAFEETARQMAIDLGALK